MTYTGDGVAFFIRRKTVFFTSKVFHLDTPR